MKNNKGDIGSVNVYDIIKNHNQFMTLKEIYYAYFTKYPEFINTFKDKTNAESQIRTFIYFRCLDRDKEKEDKKPLFFSLSPRKTKGNQIGIIDWFGKTEITEEVSSEDIDNIINHLPNNPQFDDDLTFDKPNKKESKYTFFARRKLAMLKALYNSNYMCEISDLHPSFLRKTNKKNYTEAHHLIPLSRQAEFDKSLDIPVNIISLCSNCHNQLHYGLYKKDLLRKLYDDRIELLRKHNIDVSFNTLCSYYFIDEE